MYGGGARRGCGGALSTPYMDDARCGGAGGEKGDTVQLFKPNFSTKTLSPPPSLTNTPPTLFIHHSVKYYRHSSTYTTNLYILLDTHVKRR